MARKRKYVSYQDWDKAYKLGVKSFKNDKLKAPAQDEKLLDFIYKGKKRKHKEQIELMEVWGYARDDERAREKGRMKKKQEEVEYFEKYIESFYGKNGLYAEDYDGGFTKKEIKVAVGKYMKNPKTNWGGGDSVDRELTRDRYLIPAKYPNSYEASWLGKTQQQLEDLFK